MRQTMLKIHLRDPQLPSTSIHYITRIPEQQLTDDPSKCNCKTCHRMIKARADKKNEIQS